MLPLGIGDLVRRRFEGHGISSSSESLSVKNAYNLMSFFLLDQSIKMPFNDYFRCVDRFVSNSQYTHVLF